MVHLVGSNSYTSLPETHKKITALKVVKYYSYPGPQNTKIWKGEARNLVLRFIIVMAAVKEALEPVRTSLTEPAPQNLVARPTRSDASKDTHRTTKDTDRTTKDTHKQHRTRIEQQRTSMQQQRRRIEQRTRIEQQSNNQILPNSEKLMKNGN
jgi:hypothetical protein